MKRLKIRKQKSNIISKEQALFIHNNSSKCSDPYLVKKPIARVEEQKIFRIRYYSKYCWECLNCKWESDRMEKRMV